MPQRPENPNMMSHTGGFSNALYYIKQVGNYEARILWRSWLFRIFAILILAILVLFNLFGVIGVAGSSGWPGRLIPGNVAYINFFLFTVAQVIIAAFLSADFLGRERKMDTTEVFYTRPMSNLQYVLGKTWGALQLFFGLSLVIILLSAIVTLVTPSTSLVIKPLLVYLFIYSMPSLVFILGFSFILMIIVRNQAVTFVLVLGFGAIVLFYLKSMHSGIWDFMGFYLPMHYSGFSGFCHLGAILLQRTGYLLLGFSGVLLTAYFLPRLPGHRRRSPIIIVMAAGLVLGAAAIFYGILHREQQGGSLRRAMVQQEQALPVAPGATIDSCHLQVVHSGSLLICRADLRVRKMTDTDSVILQLNTGFQVTAVLVEGQPVTYTRQNDLLYIPAPKEWADKEASATLRISYRGAPDDASIYPFVKEEDRQLLNRINPLVAGKQYAFVQDEFLMLTRETGWYPVVAWRYYRQQPAFTSYSLSVKTENKLTPLSQGAMSMGEEWVNFDNAQPLNALTLVAGPYRLDSLQVDSVEYSLASHKKYGIFPKAFANVRDTLPSLIRNLKSQYEGRLGLKYPFERLKLVEVPVHFFSYLQPWSMATDHTQPELLLIPENGGGAWFGDVLRIKDDFEKESERQGQEQDPQEVEARAFATLAGTGLLYPPWRFQQAGQVITSNIGDWNRVQVFPLYYDYVYDIYEPNYPVFRVMLGDALRSSGKKRNGSFSWGGSQDQYSALLNLNRKSLSQWLENNAFNDTITDILQLQGINFFSRISAATVEGSFLRSLNEGFDNYAFKSSRPHQWLSLLDAEAGWNNTYQDILEMKELPAFRFGEMQVVEVSVEEQIKYYVGFEVSNTGDKPGLIDTYTTFLNLEENRGRSFSNWMYQNVSKEDNGETRLFIVPAHKKVNVEMVFDQIPRNVKVETGVSRNIPPWHSYFPQGFKKDGVAPAHPGIKILGEASTKADNTDEIIVDNEDDGFFIKSKEEVKTLKDWWIRRQGKGLDDYKSLNFWNPPVTWTTGFGDNYFGDYRRSAVAKVSGNGEDVAQWKCDLPEAGNYEIQVFIPANLGRSWRYRKVKAGFIYKIYHANSDEQVESPAVNEVNGWVSLGRYFFNEGEAVVEMSDKSNFPYVVADAVKWIKQ